MPVQTMTASAATSSRRLSRWRSPIAPDAISTLVAACVLLIMPLFAIESAGWAVDRAVTLPLTIYGVLLGATLAHSRFGEVRAMIITLAVGIGAVWIAAALQLDLPLPEALNQVLRRCHAWLLDALGSGINTDELVFTMLVGLLFWILAFNSTWHLFRVERIWRVLLPPGLILLVNIGFFGGKTALDRYLFGYLLVALVLLSRSNLLGRRWAWGARGLRVPALIRRQMAALGLSLSILALAIAWTVPSSDLQQRLNEFQQFLASDPLQQIADAWGRIFAPIEGDGPATTDYYGADLLNLRGAISLGDDIIFTVEAPPQPQHYYWRSRVYERYSNGQWSPSADLRITDRSAPLDISMNAETLGGSRRAVQQHFTIGSANTRIYYVASQPQRIDRDGRVDLLFTDKPANTAMNVSVIRPLRALRQGEVYSAISMLSSASADQLRRAHTGYPDWVSSASLYIGLPNPRVLGLSRRIVSEAGADNPYDKARAIESWLRGNIRYNETISAPPASVDTVEWLLFDVQEGYCTYYATAMIVMLRHLGIPARLAAGFSQGDFDAESGRFVVRERHAHTWVEVYFPGYGWIRLRADISASAYRARRRRGRAGNRRAPDARIHRQPNANAQPDPAAQSHRRAQRRIRPKLPGRPDRHANAAANRHQSANRHPHHHADATHPADGGTALAARRAAPGNPAADSDCAGGDVARGDSGNHRAAGLLVVGVSRLWRLEPGVARLRPPGTLHPADWHYCRQPADDPGEARRAAAQHPGGAREHPHHQRFVHARTLWRRLAAARRR